jgi:hypothetical protein
LRHIVSQDLRLVKRPERKVCLFVSSFKLLGLLKSSSPIVLVFYPRQAVFVLRTTRGRLLLHLGPCHTCTLCSFRDQSLQFEIYAYREVQSVFLDLQSDVGSTCV